jgi:hypothetical protein
MCSSGGSTPSGTTPVKTPPDFPETERVFYYNAIQNTQGIIQSIDTKLHILLAFMAVLIVEGAKYFIDNKPPNCVLYTICISAWLVLSVGTAVRIISGIRTIHNPDSRVDIEGVSVDDLGFFYGERHFVEKGSSPSILCNFFCGEKYLGKKMRMHDILKQSPKDEDRVLHELVFEYAKLIYIRQTKVNRQKNAISLMAINAIATGVMLFAFMLSK